MKDLLDNDLLYIFQECMIENEKDPILYTSLIKNSTFPRKCVNIILNTCLHNISKYFRNSSYQGPKEFQIIGCEIHRQFMKEFQDVDFFDETYIEKYFKGFNIDENMLNMDLHKRAELFVQLCTFVQDWHTNYRNKHNESLQETCSVLNNLRVFYRAYTSPRECIGGYRNTPKAFGEMSVGKTIRHGHK